MIREARPGFPVSPFAMPMPQFGAPFPSFETGVPAIPALPPLSTEDDARSVLTAPSAFYFLEHAGGLSGSEIAPSHELLPKQATPTKIWHRRPERSEWRDLRFPTLCRPPFRFRCPSLTRHCFRPSRQECRSSHRCRHLSNEDDARAALTDTSRFYFLDGGGLVHFNPSSDGCDRWRPETSAESV